MPDITRPVGKFGRLPGQIPVGLRDLTYYVAGSLPRPPAEVVVPDISDWGILGNNQYGNCGVASLEHCFMADADITSEQETQATAEQAVEYYLNYTGGQDAGVVLSQYLGYVRQHGYFGRTVNAYAPVAVHDVPTLQSVVNLYDAAYCGIVVTAAMQSAFQAGQPWTTAQLNSPVVGGHAVPICGYDDTYLRIITWGSVQEISYPMWHAISSEAWAVITGELVTRHGDGRGVSLEALNADLNNLAA